MRFSSFCLIGLVLVGCGSKVDSNLVSDTPVSPVVDSKPVQGRSNENNPNRIFQLKDLGVKKVKIKEKEFDLWIMDTEDKRREGMMFVENADFKDSEGMVFAFKTLQKGGGQSGFWMHNTIAPLDIIYLSPAGKVVQIFEAKAMDDTQLVPKDDYQTVIELKVGMSKKIGLKAGDLIDCKVPAKE